MKITAHVIRMLRGTGRRTRVGLRPACSVKQEADNSAPGLQPVAIYNPNTLQVEAQESVGRMPDLATWHI